MKKRTNEHLNWLRPKQKGKLKSNISHLVRIVYQLLWKIPIIIMWNLFIKNLKLILKCNQFLDETIASKAHILKKWMNVNQSKHYRRSLPLIFLLFSSTQLFFHTIQSLLNWMLYSHDFHWITKVLAKRYLILFCKLR